jgi:plasmid stabilization system protein ParE
VELVRGRLDAAATRLGVLPTGRPGRYAGTHEKSVPRTSYILLYEMRRFGGREFILITDIVHTRRNWRKGEPPPA